MARTTREAAASTRMPDLTSRLLWSRLGAERDAVIAVDAVGTGLSDGGICATLRDLARFGLMVLAEGTSVLLCLGIHGQMSYINRSAQLVAAKLSGWPLPQDAWKYFATIGAFDAIASWTG